MAARYAIFDFDGTLVDSARGILAGMADALRDNGITPRVPLETGLIGPPLMQTLAHISGRDDEPTLSQLAKDFKHRYDSTGYRQTDVYPGIDAALRRLHSAGIPLVLATNKRRVPTLSILEQLGWSTLFEAVYCLDQSPAWENKGAMLRQMLKDLCMEPESVLYIGDTEGDAAAAELNRIPFLWVAWGYGTSGSDHPICSIPDALPNHILQSLDTSHGR